MTAKELVTQMLKEQNVIKATESSRKEHKPMDFVNAKLVVGNRVYPTKYVNFESAPGEYPIIEASAILNPCGSVPYYAIPQHLSIKNVIFNPPATIVFWSDDTKTVVKCDYECEAYDPEKGIAMAISKKMLGDNKYEYYNVFRHWLKKWEKQNKTDDFIRYLEKQFEEKDDED